MITIQNLEFAYRSKKSWFKRKPASVHPVLKGISIDINPGELFGLVGPNGSGKTTLTKLMLGVYEPDAGQVLFRGQKRPSLNNAQWKHKVGWISGASSRLFNTIDLNEHIALYQHLYSGFDREWFGNQIAEFGLANKLDKKPTEVSFGERIKFELALTLAYRPEVLILDEPTVGLDPMAIQQVRVLINHYLKEWDVCGILTSHNLKDITEICQQGGFLENGQVTKHFESRLVNSDMLEDQYREVFGT
jgi:ABC-2 type transport system ATP-binding protein